MSQTESTLAGRPEYQWAWMALAAAGILVRVWLWWISVGSNDVFAAQLHAQRILAFGMAHSYQIRAAQHYNHPPLMGLLMVKFWLWSGGDLMTFARLSKLPGLAGEALSLWCLWRFAGLRTFAIYACLPAAILVSSFHGNTDCLYAAFVLVAAVAFDRKQYFLSGTLWAAALNVKLIPLVLLPLVLIGAPDRKALKALVAGLALGIVPFLPTLLQVPADMWRSMLAYNSIAENWGLLAILNPGVGIANLAGVFVPVRDWYIANGRYVILLAITGVALLSRFRRRMPMTEQAAIGGALFLVLAPGFGLQYVVLVAPVLCLADLAAGVRWGWLSGLFLGLVYWSFMIWWATLRSLHTTLFPGPAAGVGLLAWAVLVHFCAVHLWSAWKLGKPAPPELTAP